MAAASGDRVPVHLHGYASSFLGAAGAVGSEPLPGSRGGMPGGAAGGGRGG